MSARSHKNAGAPSKRGPRGATIRRALAVLESEKTRWHDAEAVVADILSAGLREVRRQRGMTQVQLGRRLGVPQPRISGMEKHPDKMTVGLLRRVAAALAGDGGRGGARRSSAA